MTTADQALQAAEQPADKGLKPGALGLVSSVVMGVASTAPAYSLAATLGFIVAAVGLQSPIVAVLAFVPIVLTSIGYNELNKADPDCGTTFTWATRAFGPRTGWAGGWAIVAADVLVMASLAQVAGQYLFFLVGAKGIGSNPTSGWVLLAGVAWIVAMTYICYRGIEVSARLQKALLGIEIVMLLVFSVVALVRVGTGHHPAVSIHPGLSWLNPFSVSSFQAFVSGLILMLFIYWGWDTAVAVNEETADRTKTPGRAAIISTVILLLTYVLVIFAAQAFAGIGTKGIGLGNSANASDVISVLGSAVFGGSGFGAFLARLLVLMVLSSAAASTQTTILPTARTTLSMAAYRALPRAFAKMHPRYLTPTVSTLVMGGISIVLYIPMNYMSGGNIIADAVTAIGLYIAFYYGLTGFACAWYYRTTLTSSARNLWMRGILPVAGGLIMYFAGGWSLWADWDVATGNSYTSWKMPFQPHWVIGGVFMIAFLSALAGLIVGIYSRITGPAFFRKETLTRATPTLVPDTGARPGAVAPGAPVPGATAPTDPA
ncbi:MAG TPA: amino acid permease [Streptosporangiaceae bacterium]|nr:amino acid permease [Streptosporangiaceae bacterium]